MERKLILDFIGQNYNSLSDIKFKQITVFVYGKIYQNDSLGNKLLDGNKLFAYDVKLPRIYLKKFPLDKMNDGMLALAGDINQMTVFNKSDFNFELEEVYSGKDIRDLNFDYLYLYPVIKDDLKIGAILIYAENLVKDFKITQNSVTLLFNGLSELEVVNFQQNIINALLDEQNLYYIVGQTDNKYVYLSDGLCDKFKLKNPALLDNELITSFTKHHVVKHAKLKFPFEDYFVYSVNKEDFDDIKDNYLHISSLNQVELNEEFTLIIVDYSQHTDDFISFINKLNLTDKYYVCACEDGFYVLAINKKIKKTIIKQMLAGIDSFYITLHAPNEVNNKMDFSKIVKYLKEVRPNEFLYHEYLTFINYLCQDSLELNKNKHSKRIVLSSTNKDLKYPLLNYVSKGFKYLENSLEYERITVNKLNKYIKDPKSGCYVGLESISLLKRKLIEIYKKYQNKQIPLSIIVHYNKDTKKEDLYNALSLFKLYGIKAYADSSIFLNLNVIDTMELFDGCYVHKDEFSGLMKSNNKFINMFVTYFYNESKLIIFEQCENEEYNNRYEDESIYFVKESEG